jgi:hypothetical protein
MDGGETGDEPAKLMEAKLTETMLMAETKKTAEKKIQGAAGVTRALPISCVP